ncbi:cardioactive peptide-like [Pollicipes pollicipes]|uniref:cardioactive peptide-like n=1 Tax=Pollicipes pollicipes TaxID=41117 RepID=UPI001884F07D|nr:cardioactive peptide-like [Pollicipes pollicipes]
MRLDRGETLLLGAVLLCCAVASPTKPVQKREIHPNLLFQAQDKRPFCNAFTGCGRKRSDLSTMEDVGNADMTGARPAAAAEARLWQDMLSGIEDMRQRQMAPLYFRGRRSLPLEHRDSATLEVQGKTKKR